MVEENNSIVFDQFIALVDFDLCICESNYPHLGNAYPLAKEVLRKWYSQGIYLIINTCRTGKAELEAELWLLKNGIPFHKINGQHPNGLLHYGSTNMQEHRLESRKIWGHVSVDDTNIDWVENGHPGWAKLDDKMQKIIINLGMENKYGLEPFFSVFNTLPQNGQTH